MLQPVEEQMKQIRRGAADIIPEQELTERLEKSIREEKPLRVKLGLDPTAPDIHLGNAMPLHKMRTFQDLGHHAVLIIGDYTATVGDPSGQNKMRPQLSHEEVEEHAQTYLEQAGKILDLDEAEVVWNGNWFSEMSFREVLELAARLTVARCIERDDFQKRMNNEQPIGLHELLYPLMQAYDSVMVESDVELGGTDQVFNILLGRELQRQMDMEPQIAVTNPLLEGLDGTQKMSKSKGNYIGISEAPDQMFGKAMSIPDALMQKYFIMCTDLPMQEIEELTSGGVHPREAKARLAAGIVSRYYDESRAQRAREEFDRVFRQGEMPEDMTEVVLDPADLNEDAVWPVLLLKEAGCAQSNSEARRLVRQGGVSLGPDGDSLERLEEPDEDVPVNDGDILKVGKHRFFQVSIAD